MRIVDGKVIVCCPGRNFVTLKLVTEDGISGLGDATLNGRELDSIYDCHQLIREQLIDYIRTTVVHAGGLSHVRKIASLAELHDVRTGAHGATDLTPVCMAAALHFDLSVHNFGIQEYMRHTDDTDRMFPHAYTFADGAMHPGDNPGLGVEIDESLAATFPYDRAYLPVARKTDGTMHSW